MPGHIVCDFAPSAQNQRNSEGAFLPLRDGSILFVYSRYGAAGWADGAAADLYAAISQDDGRTFTTPTLLLTRAQLQADNIMSASLQRMENGDIGLFFLAKRDVDQCLCYLTRSPDEGQSWDTPVLCTAPRGYFVLNNDRVVRLRSGRLLIPTALHPITCTYDAAGQKQFGSTGPGVMHLFASDDDGYSWYLLGSPVDIPQSGGCTTGVQEPGLLQRQDGSLWCFIRTDAGRQYECFSTDDGASWSVPAPSRFTAPVSPLCAKRLQDGRILAIWNPIPLYPGREERVQGVWTGARTPLVMAASGDEGAHWGDPVPLEEDPTHGYCYTAITQTPTGALLLGYCAGGVADGATLNRLRIRRLEASEF